MGISIVSVIGKIHLKLSDMNTLTMLHILMFTIIYRVRKNIGGSNILRMMEKMRLARF